jgi:carbon monoxide dehydrogenase subunit G
VAGFHRSVVIQKPVEEVFDFATNLVNAPLLLPGVIKTEMLTDGGIRTGARFRETRGIKGKERSAVIEVVAHERPHLHAAGAAMMGMKAIYTFRFAADGSGTRVDMDALITGNLLWKLFLGLMSRMMEKSDGEYLTRLRDALEEPKAM